MSRQDKERAAFLKAIADDPYDEDTRKVFADWLEEFGFDDEAVFQRAWTPEWQRAEDRLKEFARVAGVSLVEVATAVQHYLETGEEVVLDDGFQGFGATNQFGDEIKLEEFWEAWETWTRTTLDEVQKANEPFHCCY
jgi:uncharacterized protein (TIGR02996 family)